MPMAAADIEAMIRTAFPDASVEITDLAGDGDHYAAKVTSAAFKGMPRVRQHQAVYAALGRPPQCRQCLDEAAVILIEEREKARMVTCV